MAIVNGQGNIDLARREITFISGGTGTIRYNEDQVPGPEINNGDLVEFQYNDQDNDFVRRAVDIHLPVAPPLVDAQGTIDIAIREITFTTGGTGDIRYNEDQVPGPEVNDGDLVDFQYNDQDNVFTRRASNIHLPDNENAILSPDTIMQLSNGNLLGVFGAVEGLAFRINILNISDSRRALTVAKFNSKVNQGTAPGYVGWTDADKTAAQNQIDSFDANGGEKYVFVSKNPQALNVTLRAVILLEDSEYDSQGNRVATSQVVFNQ